MYHTVLHETVEVRRPLADCFRYLRDFSTIEQWDPGVHRAAKRTAGPVREGSRFHLTLSLPGGRRTPMHYELRRLDPAGYLELVGEGEGLRALDRITLSRGKAGVTRIDYQAELWLEGLGSRTGALAQPLLRRIGRRAVEGLKLALDPEARSAPTPAPRSLADRLILPAAWQFTERGYLGLPRKAHSRYLDGRTVVLTGPTSGIGLAAACELSRLGARLILVGRDRARMEAAAEEILDFAGEPHGIRLVEADLSDPAELERAAAQILDLEPVIDVLVNNAGALYTERALTRDGRERSLAINLLAPYRLTERLMGRLTASRGQVINVSSGGQYLQALDLEDLDAARGRYDGVKAYARAKRALISLTQSWAAQHPEVGFHAMHPGWVATPGVTRSLPGFDRVMRRFLRDPRMGADTIVWLCSTDARNLGSGGFWFDRRRQPLDVIPGTRVRAPEARRLVQQLAAL